MSVRGLISIGTNSTRVLAAGFDGSDATTLLQRSIGTRIGEGLRERGHLEETAMQRTLDAVAEHLQALRDYTDDVGVIATSALRRADNERDFAARVRQLTGADMDVISGEEEAACSFAGAVSGLRLAGEERVGVLDVGGGSSEYAVGGTKGASHAVSCEIGAVRLTEAFPALAGASGRVSAEVLEQAADAATIALHPVRSFERVSRLVLVGGTCTTTVGLMRAARDSFQYAGLTRNDVDQWIARLSNLPLDERKQLPGMNPQRADILLGGLLIVRSFLAIREASAATVSTSDVLLGYLLRHPPA